MVSRRARSSLRRILVSESRGEVWANLPRIPRGHDVARNGSPKPHPGSAGRQQHVLAHPLTLHAEHREGAGGGGPGFRRLTDGRLVEAGPRAGRYTPPWWWRPHLPELRIAR